MVKMYCMGTSAEIPTNGKICPSLPTNMVPLNTKCEITCNSGSPSVEYIKCDESGWVPTSDVSCSGYKIEQVKPLTVCTEGVRIGSSPGMIVGLLFGGILVVCIIAYAYARMKTNKKKKKEGKNKSLSRAAMIAARNDMATTGVVTNDLIKAGVVSSTSPKKPRGKLVTAEPEVSSFRHSSASSHPSNPPSYHTNDPNEAVRYDAGSTGTNKSRRSRNSNSSVEHQSSRKNRGYYDYTENVTLGHQDNISPAIENGQYHSAMDTGPMYPDYYGPQGSMYPNYGALSDNGHYHHDMSAYPEHYMREDNMAYAQHGGYSKPYHVPI